MAIIAIKKICASAEWANLLLVKTLQLNQKDNQQYLILMILYIQKGTRKILCHKSLGTLRELKYPKLLLHVVLDSAGHFSTLLLFT